MITTLQSAALTGVHARVITIETEVAAGLSVFHIVGLPDTRVQEARERIRSAIKQSGFPFPYNFRITVNLAPADMRKEGTGFDLPIALTILSKTQGVDLPQNALIIGELALTGHVRPIRGALAAALAARNAHINTLFVPTENCAEAALIEGLTIYPVESLQHIVRHLRDTDTITPYVPPKTTPLLPSPAIDLAQIHGNAYAKRALEIAAAGNHHLMLSGPPGAGKTLLARALVGILPPLTHEETIEVTQIYSGAGLVPPEKLPLRQRQLRSPHHSATATALVGGGRYSRPGELTLAHRGVLFLDELPEFQRSVLEQLRQPLEDGVIHVARAEHAITFPAKFLFIAAQNPCPCGYRNDPAHACSCTANDLKRYEQKLSAPLMDRIDLFCEVGRVPLKEVDTDTQNESSELVRERVMRARAFAQARDPKPIPQETKKFMMHAAEQLVLSVRALTRLGRVCRTIADLAGSTDIAPEHVAEALSYRFNGYR